MRRRGARGGRGRSGGGGGLLEKLSEIKELDLRDLRALERPAGTPNAIDLGTAMRSGDRSAVLAVGQGAGIELLGWGRLALRLASERLDRRFDEVLVAVPLVTEEMRRAADAAPGVPFRLISVPALAESPAGLFSEEATTASRGWQPASPRLYDRVLRVVEGAVLATGAGAVRRNAGGYVLYLRGVRALQVAPEGHGVGVEYLDPDSKHQHVSEDNFLQTSLELHEDVLQLAQDPRLLDRPEARREGIADGIAAAVGARILARWLPWSGDGAEPVDWVGVDASQRAVIGLVRSSIGMAHVPAILAATYRVAAERSQWAPGTSGPVRAVVASDDVDGRALELLEALDVDLEALPLGAGAEAIGLQESASREADSRGRGSRERSSRGRRGSRDRRGPRRDDREGREPRDRDALDSRDTRDARDAEDARALPESPDAAGADAQRAPDGDDPREGTEGDRRGGRRRSRRRGRGRGRGGDRDAAQMQPPDSGDGDTGDAGLPLPGGEAGDAVPALPGAASVTSAVLGLAGAEAEAAPEADADTDPDTVDLEIEATLAESDQEDSDAGEVAQALERPAPRRRRSRAAIAVRNDTDSILAALVLARERRHISFFWVCGQEELMDFFRTRATDVDDKTDLLLVGFTAQPLPRETISTAELYRGRLEWYDHHEWAVEDLEALRDAIGRDSIVFAEGTANPLPAVMEICERRSRFTDKLVDLSGRRMSEGDMQKWGYRLIGLMTRMAANSGDYRTDISPILAGKPTELPEVGSVYEAEQEWLEQNDPRLVHFGEYQMAVLRVPDTLDAGELGRRARLKTGARLSLANRIGDTRVMLGCNEEKKHVNVMGLVDRLTSQNSWARATPGGDRVGRFEVDGLAADPERLEALIGEIVRNKSILYG